MPFPLLRNRWPYTGAMRPWRLALALLALTAPARGEDGVLERGRFIWPSPADGVVAISPAQLGYLLEGIDWRNPVRSWRPSCAG